MRQTTVFVAVALLMACLPAVAEEPRKLDPVVVTATTVETPASQLGASVTVVDGEEFQTKHYPSVDEALRKVPGVEIQRSGSLNKSSSISIRGTSANGNQVQVLVDGVRVKSPTTGTVDLSDISPDLIDRIEVIRGPQSTLYGADAIGGVVNIITKRGSGPFAARIEGQVGNYDTYTAATGFNGVYKILDYSFAASYLESNGQFQNDSSDRKSLAGRVGLTLPYDSSLAFITRYNRVHNGLPVKFVQPFGEPLPKDPVIDSNAAQTSETTILSLVGRTRPVKWWEAEVRLSRYDNDLDFTDADDRAGCPFGPGACEFPSRIRVDRHEAALLNHFHIGPWSTSTIGLEYRREHGDAQGLGVQPGFDSENTTRSVFFEQQLRFFDRLFLTGGFRVDDNDVYGTHTTGRGSAAFLIKETGTRIRGSVGSGFRAPTLNDLFFPGFSNPNLQPETSFSWDAGFDQKLWSNRIRLGFTYFWNRIENLITIAPIETPPFVASVNTGEARSSGVEATAEVDLLDTLTAYVNYTYTNTENRDTDRPLARQPFHRWNMGLTWEPIKRLQLFTEAHVESRQWEPLGSVYNPGWSRVDVGGTYRIIQRYKLLQTLDLTLRIQNVFNQDYQEVRGFPALGTFALVGLRATF